LQNSNEKSSFNKKYINFDIAATTPPFLEVEKGIINDLSDYGSVHRGAGVKSKISTKKYEESRATIKSFVNARDKDYVVFTSNTTAGMNQLAYIFSNIKGKILLSDIEHSSSSLPWIFYEGRKKTTNQVTLKDALNNNTEKINDKIEEFGKKQVITFKTSSEFKYNLKNIDRIFNEQFNRGEDEKIKLIVITGASNVTGYKPPIKKITTIAHKYGAMVIIDACQLLQHDRVNMMEDKIDFLVFSGHKMYAPFGSGVVVGNKKIFDAFWPYQMGGGNFPYISKKGKVFRYKNEDAHDPGTPNYIGARAIHYAIKQLDSIGLNSIKQKERLLIIKTYKGLSEIEGVHIYNEQSENNIINTSLLTFNLDSFSCYLLAEILNDYYGIATRAGSFCVHEFARRIMKIENDDFIVKKVKEGNTSYIPGAVRISLGLVNELEDVDFFLTAITKIKKNGVEFYLNQYKDIQGFSEYKKYK
jgi:cysteine desulfurase